MSLKPDKVLIIGIDGGDPDLIFNRFGNRLRNINSLADGGRSGVLLSTIPPATIPAWNSFYTGLDPGGHGMFDFTSEPDYNYHINFINSRYRRIPAFWNMAGPRGRKCAVLNFPSCYPPENINGVMISGFDCPLPSGGDRSFIHPPKLYDEILTRFGPYRISGFDQVSIQDCTLEQAFRDLLSTAEYKGNVAEWLLKRQEWDIFMVHFGEVDAACHHFWRHFDPGSPRRTGDEDQRLASVIPDVYGKVDEQVGRLIDAVDDKWAVILLSDHGFTGTGTVVFHINNFLHESGFLHYAKKQLPDDAVLRKMLRLIPNRLRKYLFRGLLSKATDRVEGFRRFGNIDFQRTRAFSDELNYFPSIRINRRDRYKSGAVSEREVSRLLDEISVAADSIKIDDGIPVVKAIRRREEIYGGDYVERAPDLILELNAPGGYLNGALPSKIGGKVVRRLDRSEYPGGKGSFPCGGHRREGFYILNNVPESWPVPHGIQIFDLTSIIYYILNTSS